MGIQIDDQLFEISSHLRLGMVLIVSLFWGGIGFLLYLFLPKTEWNTAPDISVLVQERIQEAVARGSSKLDLRFLSLTSIPERIGDLDLKTLLLKGNKLDSLPESLGNLKNIELLDLSENQLSQLPESFKDLPDHTLLLHGNNSLRLPAEVLGPKYEEGNEVELNSKQILEYYFRSLEASRPLNEAKLILVGHGEVGKTSLVNRLVSGTFNLGEEKTDGINITRWPVTLNRDEHVQLNIWDFGGQDIMHSTHQFFLTTRSLYLLVLNGRKGHEDEDAEYWLKLIQSFGAQSPVIIVLNKYNQHTFDLNRGALQEKYPTIRAFVETDCKENLGLDKLNEFITRETNLLPHLRDKFPANWFKIKDRLSGMQENFISFNKFREICQELDEVDYESQELLAGYLHNLGIALNYKDDPRLRDMHVLNPRWVTEGIYKILNAEKIAKQQGELELMDLERILDIEKYPVERYAFLFELMKKFELCFPFPEADDRYLIPELLGKQQPEETKLFDPRLCLNFRYSYPIKPEGILPRFIVRTHLLSQHNPRWRSGVILDFEDNRALVKVDLQEKLVTVSVTGPKESRRRLLAVIRSDFDRIHDSFNFEPLELVPVPDHPEVAVPYRDLVVFESNNIDALPTAV